MRRWVLLCALAGCSRRPPEPAVAAAAPAPAPPVDSPLVGLLDGVGQVLLLPRERQVEDVQALEAGLVGVDLPTDRLRLALLLTLGDDAVRDGERARVLLEDRVWDDTGYETLARLVLAVVNERAVRVREQTELYAALDLERQRVLELEARLEAIKAIETEIHREEGAGDGQQAEGAGG